ncbi:hypothetical protein BV22DRAFT_1050764 [Leucogyrophana mollusca]|uniref:Uncharacterized protein n=1 Tax=Leucogyrophana mollusca TaxID=85980 RepID=A0ACB8B386_9AGAM|nr:hypothetical protein BV22DRAFT_1050764 [Leucogyrophana mollusca]
MSESSGIPSAGPYTRGKRDRVDSAKSLAEVRGVKPKKKTRHSDTASKDIPVIPVSAAPDKEDMSQWDLLMKMDSWQRPGISTAQFKQLFRSCACGLVMTERVFEWHECATILKEGEGGILVDLTRDDVRERAEKSA